jgi:hypothetical protein
MRSNLKAIRQHALLHFRLNPERLTEYISLREERRAFPVYCTSGNASKPEMTPYGGSAPARQNPSNAINRKTPSTFLSGISRHLRPNVLREIRNEKWSEASQPSLHFMASSVD